MERKARSFWEGMAVGLRIAPPLAPVREDIRWLEARAGAAGTALRALVLGVTPGIIGMRWPVHARVAVIDWSVSMFRQRWPAGCAAGRAIADWRELPLRDATMDFACGDGCYTALGESGDARRLNAEAARVLKRGARLCLRCFVRPEHPVPLAQLCEDLRAGRLSNPSLFRWLFAMALHEPGGVVLARAWSEWRARFPDAQELRRAHGWDDEALEGFERWKGKSMRYCFHTLGELGELAAPHFELESVDLPAYRHGARFPRLTLRRR